MIVSEIFHTDKYTTVEATLAGVINAQPDFLSIQTAQSTRAAGDAIQIIVSDQLQEILGDLSITYTAQFARRAMADLAFTDAKGFYYAVDVKTHRIGTQFSMPNLVSVERLTRFYEKDQNYFVVLFVSYALQATRVLVDQVHFVPIEFLSWSCLTLGALGWGQIQIANSNSITVNAGYSRKNWMLELCDRMLRFYPREINKINHRIDYFQNTQRRWESVSDSSADEGI